jgi:peptide/nickel transport system permease protein
MLAYVIRRTFFGGWVVLGVLFFLFVLFFGVTNPDDIARRAIGDKAMPHVIEQWKKNHGYDKPRLPGVGHMTDNLLVEHYRRMLTFDFGVSDSDSSPILQRISQGAVPSLCLTVPEFVLGLMLGLFMALVVSLFRDTYIDKATTLLCVVLMSVPILLVIIGGQFLIGKLLRWYPISGWDDQSAVMWRFLALPVLIGVLAGFGTTVRFYRTVFLEEVYRDYVRTARAKGAGDLRVLLRHVLPNAMIPILTSVVMEIPFLFTGSLLLEAAFGIPGLGSMTVDAINANDFSTLRTMVFIGSLLFVAAQILTDISYTIADPRVRLE